LIYKLNKKIDIYLVFSNDEDYSIFQLKDDINHIILDKSNDCIITTKKFYGLKTLINSKYDYIICCDAEINVIPENIEFLYEKINTYFKNKTIFGSKITDDPIYKSINFDALNLFNKNDYSIIIDKINPYLYFWYSELPVYKRSHLVDFFNTIQDYLVVCSKFDYLIYSYYLVLKHNFIIKDITYLTESLQSFNGSLETINTNDENILNNLTKLGVLFTWINQTQFNKNKEYFINNHTVFIFNLDRK
jgi:hypothetical protein